MQVARPRIQHPHLWRRELRATAALAWPLILTNLTMALIGAIDVVMLGWLGATELAAASLGLNLFMLFAIFSMGLVTASSPMMAKELGAHPHSVRDIRRTFRQSCWAALAVCVPIWAVLWHTEAILLFLGQVPDLAKQAQVYVRVYMWSMLPFLWTTALRNFLSALEKPLWSLIIGIAGVAANALFNYALIFGNFGAPRLELVGAGLGSILANIFMLICMLMVVTFHRDFRRYRLLGRWWRSDWPRFAELWRLGLPIAISFGLEGGVFSVAAMLMGLISIQAVAAHAVALQIASLSFMIPMGLGQAATVRVGLGYGRADRAMIMRAGWTSFALSAGFMTVMAAVMIAIPELLVSIFLDPGTPANRPIFDLAVQFLFIAALFQIVDGVQVAGQGMLRGLQDTRVPMLIAGFGYWVVGIGAGVLLGFGLDWRGVGIWAGLAIGLSIVAVLIMTRWTMRARIGLLPA